MGDVNEIVAFCVGSHSYIACRVSCSAFCGLPIDVPNKSYVSHNQKLNFASRIDGKTSLVTIGRNLSAPKTRMTTNLLPAPLFNLTLLFAFGLERKNMLLTKQQNVMINKTYTSIRNDESLES